MDITFHYPPELLNLLVDTIPRLNRGKPDVFNFFRGAGVNESIIAPPLKLWTQNKESVNKFDIARQILVALNERGEASIRERREIIKRVVEFDSFDACWDNDRLAAKGLVAEVRKVVERKDSFTRMKNERDAERNQRVDVVRAEQEATRQRSQAVADVRQRLFSLFGMTDAKKRGKLLEGVMNDLFKVYGVSIREAFTVKGEDGEGVIEQVDGVIELRGHLYLVEMKWWKDPVGVPQISEHMMRVLFRSECRAIVISASGFTQPAVTECRMALTKTVVCLCTVEEIVRWLEQEADIPYLLDKKIHAAMLDRNPFLELLSEEAWK